MKKVLFGTSALVLIASAQAAHASDQSPHLPTKTPIVPSAIINWTGCYIGVHGGGAVSDTFISTSFEGNNNFLHGGGGFAGGQIGCNYQNGAMVFGLEGEAWSGLTNPLYFTCLAILRTFSPAINGTPTWRSAPASRSTAGCSSARPGLAEGRFAFSEADTNGAFAHGASTLTGVLLGVGLESNTITLNLPAAPCISIRSLEPRSTIRIRQARTLSRPA